MRGLKILRKPLNPLLLPRLLSIDEILQNVGLELSWARWLCKVLGPFSMLVDGLFPMIFKSGCIVSIDINTENLRANIHVDIRRTQFVYRLFLLSLGQQ